MAYVKAGLLWRKPLLRFGKNIFAYRLIQIET